MQSTLVIRYIHFLTSARGVVVRGKNAEQNAKGGQCRVQCTRGAHKCTVTGGRAVHSAQAQACPGQPVVAQKDTEYNSPLQPWSRDCLRLQHTNCYKVKLVREILAIFGCSCSCCSSEENNELYVFCGVSAAIRS